MCTTPRHQCAIVADVNQRAARTVNPASVKLQPLTVKKARREIQRRGLGRVPNLGPLVASSWDGHVVTGGPAPTDSLTFLVRLYSAAPSSSGAAVVAAAVGRAGLEMGYPRAAVRLPLGDEPRALKDAGWRHLQDDVDGAWWGVERDQKRGAYRIVPLGQKAANDWINDKHEHHSPSTGSFFSIGVEGVADGKLHCVAQVGVMRSRQLMRISGGRGAEILRVASDKTPHVASLSIGACARTLQALGYDRIVSYTILGEKGTSYRGAGWWPTIIGKGGEWSREARTRKKAAQPARKVRWETGSGSPRLGKDEEQALLREIADAVGKTEIPSRLKPNPPTSVTRPRGLVRRQLSLPGMIR